MDIRAAGPPSPVLTAPQSTPAPVRTRRFPGLLKSAAVRFAALYVLLFGLSAVALAVVVWWQTAGLLARQTDAAINADVQGLSERWDEGGTPALLAIIRARLAADPADIAIYLLADRSYTPLLGNLSRWPNGVTVAQDWFELPVQRNGMSSLARVHRFDLPDGFHLLVGRDAALGAELRRLLTGALLWAALVVLLLGGAGAVVVRGVFRRALAGVFATASAISAGDFARRVPRTGSGDEFDSLAETINDMLDRINRLIDGVRHVSDAIAHDLRTPITRARARLEDAARHATDTDSLHAAIERAQRDLDEVVVVFQALLRISEIESGSRRPAFAAFDLVPLIHDLAEFYGAAAEEQNRHVALALPAQAWVAGDRALLQQALANLLDNALKFSPRQSVIDISVLAGEEIILTIADHGPGMSAPDRARATERFFRAERARSTPGSGLGLSLVEAVAQLHGGSLSLLDNNPGLRAQLRMPPLVAGPGVPGRAAIRPETSAPAHRDGLAVPDRAAARP